MLDDKRVDALVIATPDHWHALGTIWACQAGKDVYVEKPTSHSIWESRKMVEAARKHGRVVQVGAQCRSAPYAAAAIEYLKSGKLGEIHLVKVFNSKPRSRIGSPPDQPVPAGVDYDMWLGPAPMRPFNENHFHAWNWFWIYSGGDLVNDGVHQLDLARWCIGRSHPRSVYSTGGLHFFKDDQDTPDTQIVTWDYDGLTMTFEQTLWSPYQQKTPMNLRDRDVLPNWPFNGTRVEIYGSKQWMMLGPARRRLGGLRRRLQVGGPPVRPAVQRRARRQLRRLHPQPQDPQCRHRGAALLHPALPLRQHLLPPGPQADDRSGHRGIRGRRRGEPPGQADLPQALGRAGDACEVARPLSRSRSLRNESPDRKLSQRQLVEKLLAGFVTRKEKMVWSGRSPASCRRTDGISKDG